MTAQEMAIVAGVSKKTVLRTAKTNGIGVVLPGKETTFTEPEAIQIMAEMRKKGFIEPRQNVPQPRQNDPQGDLAALIGPIVAETIKQLLPYITGANQVTNYGKIPAQTVQALPPIDPRKELNMLAREAGYAMGDYREPYNQIYKHAYYRLGVNLRERAKNRNMDVLDYATAEGFMPQLVAIAREIFK